MKLRPPLLPPVLDEKLVSQLGALADELDGARPGDCEDNLATFNRLAGTRLPLENFQGIYGAEDHVDWVRRVLCIQRIRRVPDVTREELIEVTRRAMSYDSDAEAYRRILDVNVPRPHASSLLFHPPEDETIGWQGTISEYDPTPEQIVEWAFMWRG